MMTFIKLAIVILEAIANNTTINHTTVVDVQTHGLCDDVVAIDDGTDVWEFYGTGYHKGDDVMVVRIGDCVVIRTVRLRQTLIHTLAV